MRPIHFVLILLLGIFALAVFLVYGGQRLPPRSMLPAQTASVSALPDGQLSAAPDVSAKLDEMSKRIDALAEEIAQLRRSSERTPATSAATTPENTAELRREDVLRLIAEDRDLLALPGKIAELRRAVASCSINSGYPSGKPLGDSVAVLVEAEKRFEEIQRRLLPVDLSAESEGPRKAQFDLEIAALREWRRSELARIVGEHFADVLIGSLGSVQRF